MVLNQKGFTEATSFNGFYISYDLKKYILGNIKSVKQTFERFTKTGVIDKARPTLAPSDDTDLVLSTVGVIGTFRLSWNGPSIVVAEKPSSHTIDGTLVPYSQPHSFISSCPTSYGSLFWYFAPGAWPKFGRVFQNTCIIIRNVRNINAVPFQILFKRLLTSIRDYDGCLRRPRRALSGLLGSCRNHRRTRRWILADGVERDLASWTHAHSRIVVATEFEWNSVLMLFLKWIIAQFVCFKISM